MNLSGYITTFTMEVLGLYLVLAFFATKQYAEGQIIHNLRCIPPMIDFEAKFANTLRLRPEFRRIMENIKKRRFAPPGCQNFDSSPVDNIWALNVQRCTQGSPVEFHCITTTQAPTTTTTTEATTTTTRPETTTTTDSFIVPWRSSTTTDVEGIPSPATVSPRVTYRTSKPPSSHIPPPSPPDTGVGGDKSTTTIHPGDQDTTGAYIPDPSVTGVVPTVEAVVSKESNITTTVISIGAGIVGLLLIIGLLFLCRKKRWCSNSETWETKSQSSQLKRPSAPSRLGDAVGQEYHAMALHVATTISASDSIHVLSINSRTRKHLYVGNGAIDAHLKHEKVQRQRSDCQPISAISPNLDTYDPFDPASPTIHTVYGGYNRGFVTNGRKWRPDGSVNSMGADTISEAGSQKSSASSVPMNSRYIILREDSTSSAYNFNFHYNTLRAIDHPHTLTTSGFGESSTDATLPRTLRKKRNRGVAETDFCYSIDKGSRDSSRYASKESMVSDGGSDMFGSRSSIKSTGSLKNGGHVPNGMVIPVPNGVDHGAPHTHRLYKKNSSTSSSRKNSEDFDRHSQGTIDEADQGLDVSNRALNGQRNHAFRDDDEINIDDSVFVESEKQYKSWGVPSNTDPNSMDSLVNKKNIDMFSYDNHAMEKGSLPRSKGKGKNGYVDPPIQFRDPSEPAVAVIQPVKGDPRRGNVDRNGITLESKRKDSKRDNSYVRPPVSKKPSRPMKNGSIPVAATPPYSHNPSPTSTATKNTNRSPSSNVPNGKLPHGSPSKSGNSKSSFLYGEVKDYSHTNGHHKPAAEVNPLPKHADVRL